MRRHGPRPGSLGAKVLSTLPLTLQNTRAIITEEDRPSGRFFPFSRRTEPVVHNETEWDTKSSCPNPDSGDSRTRGRLGEPCGPPPNPDSHRGGRMSQNRPTMETLSLGACSNSTVKRLKTVPRPRVPGGSRQGREWSFACHLSWSS